MFVTSDAPADPQKCVALSKLGARDIYAIPATSPYSAGFSYTVITPQITINVDTYIVLRSTVADTFAKEILFKIDNGSWTKGKVIGSLLAILPVKFTTAGSTST